VLLRSSENKDFLDSLITSGITESIGVAVVVTDENGVIRSWNGAAEELYGWTALEALDQEIHVLLPSRSHVDGVRVTHYTSRQSNAHGTFVVEDKFGALRYVESRTHPVREDSGRVIGTVGVSWDITDRVRATQRLADSESHYRSNFSASKVPQMSLSIDRRIESVNPAMCELVGYSEADLVGCSVLCFLHPADMQAFLVDLDAIWSGLEDLGSTVYRCLHNDGHTLWLQVMPSVVRNADGERHSVSAIVLDVTEQRRAQEHYGVVMGTMSDGLFSVDDHGLITFINRAGARMLGWSEEELRGRDSHQTFHYQRRDGSTYPSTECPLVRVTSEHRTARVTDEVFWRRDGSMLPVAYSAAPINVDGENQGVVVVFRDRTHELDEADRAQRAIDELSWVGRIRDALDDDRLVLYTQRVASCHGDDDTEELLLRMLGPNGETIAPGAFLPVAESYGLIGEIDRWVLRRACSIVADGRRVEVNVSAVTVGDPGMVEFIRRELEVAGSDPANLVLELTETALMSNEDAGEEFARAVTDLGCGLALDDFGTGFGSLTYLKRLPLSYLKIDREFVGGLVGNEANQHVVRAVVNLARAFGQKTIAEGVETEETLEFLKEVGVDYVQGFYIERPRPFLPDTVAAA
jgi:PAS domain S-box-containing protein